MIVSIEPVSRIDTGDIIRRSPYATVVGADVVLTKCMFLSACAWIGKYNGEVACIWGLIPPTILSDQAYLWLLTTELVEEHKFYFVRRSQQVIEVMLEKFPVIVGTTNARDKRAVRWLKWLGAEFEPYTEGELKFAIRRKS